MSRISVKLEGFQEPQTVPAGGPYVVEIVNAEYASVNAKGVDRDVLKLLCRLVEVDLVNPKLVEHTFWLPMDSDSPEDLNRAQGRVIAFKKAIGDTEDGLPGPEELVGTRVSVILGTKTDDYGTKNTIKRFVIN